MVNLWLPAIGNIMSVRLFAIMLISCGDPGLKTYAASIKRSCCTGASPQTASASISSPALFQIAAICQPRHHDGMLTHVPIYIMNTALLSGQHCWYVTPFIPAIYEEVEANSFGSLPQPPLPSGSKNMKERQETHLRGAAETQKDIRNIFIFENRYFLEMQDFCF